MRSVIVHGVHLLRSRKLFCAWVSHGMQSLEGKRCDCSMRTRLPLLASKSPKRSAQPSLKSLEPTHCICWRNRNLQQILKL